MKVSQSTMMVFVSVFVAIVICDLSVADAERHRDTGSGIGSMWEEINAPALVFAMIIGGLTNTVHLWNSGDGDDTWFKIWFFIGQCIQWETIALVAWMLVLSLNRIRQRWRSLWAGWTEPLNGGSKHKR